MCTWNDDTPAIVPAGARISAGSSAAWRGRCRTRRKLGEPVAHELHAVAGVAGEADDDPIKGGAEKKHLRDLLIADAKVTAQLDADKIAELFEPMAYQGASQALIDRLLASLNEG